MCIQGGPVDKNLTVNARDAGSIPGLEDPIYLRVTKAVCHKSPCA